MFGTLRLILALLVVASHVEVIHELDLGNVAVTIFFLLSGYVMTATVRRYYARQKYYRLFLMDRAGRIFPQYLFWVLASILWVLFFDRTWRPLGWQVTAENLLLLPGMYGVYDLKPWLTGVRYISQTWSLSLEWHFYMLLPWLLLIPRARTIAFGASLAIFTLATLNIISPYVYSYHLLPGVLFIFLLGSVAYDGLSQAAFDTSRLLKPFLYLMLLGIVANSCKTLHLPYTPEVYVGIIIGLPLLLWLARLPSHWLDNWLGNLSYGVFLGHDLVLAVIYKLDILHNRWAILFWACLIAMVLAVISYYAVEKPFVAWRHALRKRTAAAKVAGLNPTLATATCHAGKITASSRRRR